MKYLKRAEADAESKDRRVREAVETMLNTIRAGGEDAVVLLSPACASFDQWKNFEARGDAFRTLVQKLAAEATA